LTRRGNQRQSALASNTKDDNITHIAAKKFSSRLTLFLIQIDALSHPDCRAAPQRIPNEQSRAPGACKLSPLASIPSSTTAKEAILNTASEAPITLSMPGDNIPESMGEDFSESVGDYISE